MNYWERHIGDYARDTAHLSLLEHGVYTILLDRYYATEEGIPADQAHRLARARTDDERAAVDAVLAEFFRLVDGLWINRRVEEEVAKANARINAARENGKKGGNPKKKAGYNEQGFLYAVQRVTGGPVKVGITKYPAPRMSDLRSKVGAITTLALIEVSDMGLAESTVHKAFAENLDGEWIHADPILIVAECHRVSQGLGTEPAPKFAAGSQTHQTPDTSKGIPSESKGVAPKLALPPWLEPDAWQAWHAFRNSRKGWTAHARTLSLRKLTELHTQGHDPRAVIEQSIERGWTGLFPLREDSTHAAPHAGQTHRLSAVERVRANVEAGNRRDADFFERPAHLVAPHG